jgi:hypothetical protein
MSGLTPIAGAHTLTRVIPVPSSELEKLPPAAPLPDRNEATQTEDLVQSEEAEANAAMRFTPPEPAELTAADEATAQQTRSESTSFEAEPEATTPAQRLPPGQADTTQSVGTYLDLFA